MHEGSRKEGEKYSSRTAFSVPAWTAADVVVRRATRQRHSSTRWAVRQQETWLRKIKGFVSSLRLSFLSLRAFLCNFARRYWFFPLSQRIWQANKHGKVKINFSNVPWIHRMKTVKRERKKKKLSIGKQNVKCLRCYHLCFKEFQTWTLSDAKSGDGIIFVNKTGIGTLAAKNGKKSFERWWKDLQWMEILRIY